VDGAEILLHSVRHAAKVFVATALNNFGIVLLCRLTQVLELHLDLLVNFFPPILIPVVVTNIVELPFVTDIDAPSLGGEKFVVLYVQDLFLLLPPTSLTAFLPCRRLTKTLFFFCGFGSLLSPRS